MKELTPFELLEALERREPFRPIRCLVEAVAYNILAVPQVWRKHLSPKEGSNPKGSRLMDFLRLGKELVARNSFALFAVAQSVDFWPTPTGMKDLAIVAGAQVVVNLVFRYNDKFKEDIDKENILLAQIETQQENMIQEVLKERRDTVEKMARAVRSPPTRLHQ